jgi:hypothetical protein
LAVKEKTMGQKLAAHDATGAIIAFYDDIDSPPPDGVAVVEITDDEWQACLTTPGHTIKDGALVAPTPPTKAEALATLRASLCAAIDAAAEQTYAALGGTSPGRVAEHSQAHADALAFKDAGYQGAVPASVQAWATASGATAKGAATSIMAAADAWAGALVAIRAARLQGEAAVNAAKTAAAAQAAADDTLAELRAMRPAP